MVNDPIGDALTRIRNACMRGYDDVKIPYSKMLESIISILKKEKYIRDYNLQENEKNHKEIIVKLPFEDDTIRIKKLIRISRPGLRKYVGYKSIPKVLNGLGICILSTTKGIKSGKEAKQEHVGGELLCAIY